MARFGPALLGPALLAAAVLATALLTLGSGLASAQATESDLSEGLWIGTLPSGGVQVVDVVVRGDGIVFLFEDACSVVTRLPDAGGVPQPIASSCRATTIGAITMGTDGSASVQIAKPSGAATVTLRRITGPGIPDRSTPSRLDILGVELGTSVLGARHALSGGAPGVFDPASLTEQYYVNWRIELRTWLITSFPSSAATERMRRAGIPNFASIEQPVDFVALVAEGAGTPGDPVIAVVRQWRPEAPESPLVDTVELALKGKYGSAPIEIERNTGGRREFQWLFRPDGTPLAGAAAEACAASTRRPDQLVLRRLPIRMAGATVTLASSPGCGISISGLVSFDPRTGRVRLLQSAMWDQAAMLTQLALHRTRMAATAMDQAVLDRPQGPGFRL